MQAIKCELCGSTDIMKKDGFFQCQNCGTKYTIEEARKMLGVVKIDKSEDIDNLLTLARRFFDENNYTESEKYYELALRETPNNWEASFFRAYCHALVTGTTNVDESLNSITNGTTTSLKLIYEYLGETKQPQALAIVVRLVSRYIYALFEYIDQASDFDRHQKQLAGDKMISLLDQCEQIILYNYSDQAESILTIRKTYYTIVKKCPNTLKWGERRELLARLKAETES